MRMRNIRIFVEFASVVMPGAVLLLMMSLLFAPSEFLTSGFATSALGIAAGLAFAFAAGHVIQGFSQLALEPIWKRVQLRTAAEWAILRFEGHSSVRYLTDEQIDLLAQQYPLKLGITFPKPPVVDKAVLESAVSHAEAFLYSAKANEHLDDLSADYKLNKGLFTAFLLLSIAMALSMAGLLPSNADPPVLLPGSLFAAACSFLRMDYHSRKYAQTLFLQFLTTASAAREGSGKGEGGGGGGFPMGMGRGAGPRGAAPAATQDEDAA
jgi:hypothetical protein